jgi:phosphoglycolate phosphatase
VNERRATSAIFDLDGTLIDSLPGIEHSIKAAFTACGIVYPDANLRSLIGPPIKTILSQIAKTSAPDVLADLENAFRTSYDTEGWRKSSFYPGTEAALTAMHHSGIRLFVVTNKPRHISMRALEMGGVQQLFECIVTRDSRAPQYADKKEMLGFVLDSCILDPRECVFIGDTEEDSAAAAAYDMRFVHVSHGYGTIGDNCETPVHLRLKDFSQLPQWICLELAHDR